MVQEKMYDLFLLTVYVVHRTNHTLSSFLFEVVNTTTEEQGLGHSE